MMMGFVVHLPPICRLPKLKVLVEKGENTPSKYCEVEGSFHKKKKIMLDKSL